METFTFHEHTKGYEQKKKLFDRNNYRKKKEICFEKTKTKIEDKIIHFERQLTR